MKKILDGNFDFIDRVSVNRRMNWVLGNEEVRRIIDAFRNFKTLVIHGKST